MTATTGIAADIKFVVAQGLYSRLYIATVALPITGGGYGMRVIVTLVAVCIVNVVMWNAQAHNASVFCDRRTASGSMNCLGYEFAHRSLPLRSRHTLCSHARCVIATVVDRGPAAWTGRSFDLSPGLARALGVDGLGSVWLR